jgi:hypothetical protein
MQNFKKKFYSVYRRLLSKFGIYCSWNQIETFNENWKNRIATMANYIGGDDSVVDMGCGPMWLKEFIPATVTYYPVDYRPRDENTIICNFNKLEYPKIEANIYFLSGSLEYITDPTIAVEHISIFAEKCILSYCTLNKFNDIKLRKYRGWKNHLRESELIHLFSLHKMMLLSSEHTKTGDTIFVFKKNNQSSPGA